METPFSNDKNLSVSQRSLTKQQHWETKSAERKLKWCKFTLRVKENMQSNDVQAASETNVFTGTWLPLLRIPFSADLSMGISRRTLSEERVPLWAQNDSTLTANLTGASADSSLCSPLHDYQEEHWERAPMSPNLYNSQKSTSNLGIANVDMRELQWHNLEEGYR